MFAVLVTFVKLAGGAKVGWVSPPAVIETVPVGEIQIVFEFCAVAGFVVVQALQTVKFGEPFVTMICPRRSKLIVTGKVPIPTIRASPLPKLICRASDASIVPF